MPSKLVGLHRKLGWNDFKGKPTPAEQQELQQIASQNPNKTVGMAGIHSSFSVDWGGATDPVLSGVPNGKAFTLDDSIVVTITFDSQKSWKDIAALNSKEESFLLDHEQGHYDFTALIARDCFIDLMILQSSTQFPSKQDGQDAANKIVSDYQSKLRRIQKTYDNDTTHGAWVTTQMSMMLHKESFQIKWEGFNTRARTEERQPPMTSPDGIPYKVPLLKVLEKGGFLFP